jgi:internalin A
MESAYSIPLKIFISYSHANIKEKNEIVRSLSQSAAQFEILSDDMLKAGDEWNAVLTKLRAEADVFLLLVSPYYLQSKTIEVHELPQILKKAETGTAYIIPFILEECDWHNRLFAKFQAFPKFGQPLNTFKNKEAVYQQLDEALTSLYFLLLNEQAKSIIERCKASRSSSLDLSSCNLYSIPRDLLNMEWLEKLDLQKNALRRIENLDALINLEYLDLSQNEITDIEGLNKLVNLKYLDLEKNRLSVIKNLDNNLNLETLGVSTNNIESLLGIQHLLQLKSLYAARNKLRVIDNINGLVKLKRIVLTDNPMNSIYSLLPKIKSGIPVALKYALKSDEEGIFIKGNPIAEPPLEVIALGNQAIIDHFEKKDQHGDKKLEVVKLILVGNSGVGKTNFSQFLRNQQLNEKHISTDTLDIQTWKAPFLKAESGEEMQVNIFDFGGQDYYHDLHRLYYSHDTAYILLWDTSTNYYDTLKENLSDGTELDYENFPIEYWLESIRYNLFGKEAPDFNFSGTKDQTSANVDNAEAHMPDVAVLRNELLTTAPVLVLQNKIDQGEGLLNQVILRNNYPNIATFFNISLNKKIRTNSIYEVLDDCLSKLNLSGRKLILYQHEIIEKYMSSTHAFEILSLSEFKDRCELLISAANVTLDMDDAKAIAGILTNLGVLYYDQLLQENNNTEGKVFTRIDTLNDLIRKIMNEAKLGNDKGLFKREQIASFEHISDVMPLLLKNNSIIAMDDNVFLVPQFLQVKPEPYIQNFTRAFIHCHIRYVYTAYFHKTILMSLFAKFLGKKSSEASNENAVKGIYYWRNGLILSQDASGQPQMVFINFVKEKLACRIELRTLYPFRRTGLERDIEKEMDELNKGWSYIKEVSVNSEDFFDVKQMIEQVKKMNFVFQGNVQKFTVNDFKHLVNFEKIPKRLFVSYSSQNADFIKRFWTHLDVLRTAGYIEPWYDRKIEPGSKWDDTIQKEMLNSDLVIFLLSPDFLATPYIMNEEVKNAMKMETDKQCELFFVQLLPCSWGETDLKKYQMLLEPAENNKDQVFIGTPDNDKAWKTIIDTLIVKVRPA